MTERIDHAAEARQHIDWAHDQQAQEGDMGNVPRDNALLAQAHATLALVEQQRIANVIALMQMQVECDEKTEELAAEAMLGLVAYERTQATPFGGPDEVLVMHPDIREALGL